MIILGRKLPETPTCKGGGKRRGGGMNAKKLYVRAREAYKGKKKKLGILKPNGVPTLNTGSRVGEKSGRHKGQTLELA